MDKYQDRLEQMCQKCQNHEMCMGTGCEDKKTLQGLISNYYICKNELCLKCGNYKEAHLGKCDSCKWCEVSK